MKIDSKGNIIVGTTAILIITLLFICIFVVTSINYIQNENIDSQSNDNFKYVVDDYTLNLEILEREAIDEATQKVFNGLPVINSENQIKKNLNKLLDERNEEYEKKYDVKINSETLSVENTDSPWKLLFKVKLPYNKAPITSQLLITGCPFQSSVIVISQKVVAHDLESINFLACVS